MAESGYVYVLFNKAMPRFVKVGFSIDPQRRARELSGTGLPLDYVVVKQWHVHDMRAAERAAHLELASFRVSDRREHFAVSQEIAVETLDRVLSSHLVTESTSWFSRAARVEPAQPRSISRRQLTPRLPWMSITVLCILIWLFQRSSIHQPTGAYSPPPTKPATLPQRERVEISNEPEAPSPGFEQSEEVASSILAAIREAGEQPDTLDRLCHLVESYYETEAAEIARRMMRDFDAFELERAASATLLAIRISKRDSTTLNRLQLLVETFPGTEAAETASGMIREFEVQGD